MSKVFQTMAASLRHAAWTNKAAIIGGGVYNRDECSAAAEALETFPAMLAALRNLTEAAASLIDYHDDDETEAAIADARAILTRIDGAPIAQPAVPISEAGDHCASCGAEEGESHGAQCETRGFAMGVDARRLDTGALRTVAGDDAAWLEATAGRDGGEF